MKERERQKILFVDDEEPTVDAIASLGKKGFFGKNVEVLTALDYPTALALVQISLQNEQPISLIVGDITPTQPPNLWEFIRMLGNCGISIPIIATSGYDLLSLDPDNFQPGHSKIVDRLAKPYGTEKLREVVLRALK